MVANIFVYLSYFALFTHINFYFSDLQVIQVIAVLAAPVQTMSCWRKLAHKKSEAENALKKQLKTERVLILPKEKISKRTIKV